MSLLLFYYDHDRSLLLTWKELEKSEDLDWFRGFAVRALEVAS